ncbi:hypothetical protein FCM35_KLT11251 [Carex littledalei]|uniref:Uncharacterized protein n=1 Tax=Carex littledalei TaxID=544730 RepID=A0A833VIG7_9POAL|nr:hypothetical protein FCM35_KLT11251 [Carex littledalei]
MTSLGSSPHATPMAASSSPPPPHEYPSAAKISDSICFPQYTASLKCTLHFPPLSLSRFSWFLPFQGENNQISCLLDLIVVTRFLVSSMNCTNLSPEMIEICQGSLNGIIQGFLETVSEDSISDFIL